MGSGGWEELRVRRGEESSVIRQLLRFYRIGDAATIAVIRAVQTCKGGPSDCVQHYTLRINRFPSFVADAEERVDSICSGSSTALWEEEG
jgi:hypothetical protein